MSALFLELTRFRLRDETPEVPGDGATQQIVDALKVVFSWIVLTATAVIVSGVLLAKLLKLESEGQLFSVNLLLFRVKASNSEVLLGFAFFIPILFAETLLGGAPIYKHFKMQFGFDPGQFTSLCIMSSFTTITISIVCYLLFTALAMIRTKRQRLADEEFRRLVGIKSNHTSHSLDESDTSHG